MSNIVKATLKNVRMSPLKMRVVTDGAHKRSAVELRDELARSQKKASRYVVKVLRSAIANAVNNHGMKEADLVVDSLQVTEGPRRKMASYRARGRMNINLTRYSHIMVQLADTSVIEGEKEVAEKKEDIKAEEKKEKKPTKKKETKTESKKDSNKEDR